jgi:FkbM family methyltransferase
MKRIGDIGQFFSTHPLTCDAPLRAWVRFVGWQIRSRLQAESRFRWVDGQSLIIRRGMTGATGNIYTGLHEFADMMVVLHFLRPGDLFFDIGSNIGSYTVLASGVCKARTWAFEPDPDTAKHLKRNVTINALDGVVTIRECALGAVRGRVGFTVGRDTMNKVAEDDEVGRTVDQETLDHLSANVTPNMMKIDVEGYEEQVLCGAAALLSREHLKVIELETVSPAVEGMMAGNGFERMYYDPFTRGLSLGPNGLPASNSLFIRDRDFVSGRLATAPQVDILGRHI